MLACRVELNVRGFMYSFWFREPLRGKFQHAVWSYMEAFIVITFLMDMQ